MGRPSFASVPGLFVKSALALAALAGSVAAQPSNGILLERWDNIGGVSVSDLINNANYPNNPTSRTYPSLYEIPVNVADNYGTRTRAYVTPPSSGNYTFWISGDDNSELWLGTNDQASTARLIASVPGWTNSREWTKYSQQQSSAIFLNGGTRYYIETRQKEGGGGDNLAVGWQGPGIGGDAERPIPSSRLAPFLLATAPVITAQPAPRTVNLGQTANFTVTATGTAPLTYQWRKNGANISGANAASYTTPATVAGDNGAQFSVVVSNAAGSVTSANALLTVILPPAITTQPANQSVLAGQTATFTVTATGTAPLTYQWRKNGADIAGAASASYTTPPTVAADNGAQFSVVISNAAGSLTSASANLTVNVPPAITTQPSSVTVDQGGNALFSVVASGTAPLSYQWRKNGVDYPGEVSSSLILLGIPPSDNGAVITVVVSNPYGTVTSANAVITVNTAPTIIAQPQPKTVNVGQTAAFSVTAGGANPLSYQWRKNGVSIPGATAATYTTPPATAADNGALFSVVVTNSLGSVASSEAALTVVIPPVITTQPAGQSVNTGMTATFTVTASGTAPLSYQWRKNGANIAGATSASHTTPAATLADNGALYSVVVTNAAGSVTSANAVLTVIYVATNSRKIAVSGELVDASGNPVGYPSPVTVDAIVKLQTAATGGATVYTEEFRAAAGKGIQVTNGLFVARLGEGATSQNLQQVVSANADLWVEVTVDDGTPDVLLPRTPLTASPYALGGTPAPAAVSIAGAGDPNAANAEGELGAIYVNETDNSTWLKLKSGWKRMD